MERQDLRSSLELVDHQIAAVQHTRRLTVLPQGRHVRAEVEERPLGIVFVAEGDCGYRLWGSEKKVAMDRVHLFKLKAGR